MKDDMLDKAFVAKLIDMGKKEDFSKLEKVVLSICGELQDAIDLPNVHNDFWHDVFRTHTIEDVVALMKSLTMSEVRFGLRSNGNKSIMRWLCKKLFEKNEVAADKALNWVASHTNNSYLSFGESEAKTVEEYRLALATAQERKQAHVDSRERHQRIEEENREKKRRLRKARSEKMHTIFEQRATLIQVLDKLTPTEKLIFIANDKTHLLAYYPSRYAQLELDIFNSPGSALHGNVHRYTAPCSDNGRQFVKRDRIHLIEGDLEGTSYSLYATKPLAFIYKHTDYIEGAPTILISTHIDSLYTEYHSRCEGDNFIGTYDNSATNAIAVSLMRDNNLPPQVLVAFTGNEESEMAGADQAIKLLRQGRGNCDYLEFVLTLDLTYEGYPEKAYTIENVFCRETSLSGSILKFEKEESTKEYLRSIVNDPEAARTEDDDPDESWQYDEHGLNGASLCLPCDPVDGEDMHSEEGVRIMKRSVDAYAEVLSVMAKRIVSDISKL